jgi:YD repeat-containing protein
VTLGYTYDGALPRTTTWSGAVAGTVERRYDHLHRVKEVEALGTTTAFGYDGDGLLTSAGPVTYGRDAANGRVASSATTGGGAITEAWTYDAFGQVEGYEARSNGTVVFSLGYGHDAAGRITSIGENANGVSATKLYDYRAAATGIAADSGRLEIVTEGPSVITYGYDPNGNRTTVNGVTVGTYDNQDRLTAYGSNAYTYTAGGDLATKTVGSDVTTYTYDLLGNLRTVVLPGGGSANTITYVVDGQNRRVAKKKNGVFLLHG